MCHGGLLVDPKRQTIPISSTTFVRRFFLSKNKDLFFCPSQHRTISILVSFLNVCLLFASIINSESLFPPTMNHKIFDNKERNNTKRHNQDLKISARLIYKRKLLPVSFRSGDDGQNFATA